ncbi:MAG: isocitrate/isopropylmalate family dehydrogenase [Ignavibacteriales bacterium]|nr:isocitrate/isopropylmalate family dehydrogenase [Ignavibacteriales bacterium]
MVDVVIFRQNTECLYAGVEWTNPPATGLSGTYDTSKFAENFGKVPVEELVSLNTGSLPGRHTERILMAAFEHAVKYGYKSVTVCEKPNVIRETSGLMWKLAKEMQKTRYSRDIKLLEYKY